jgi:hypothetical protein
MLARNGVMGLYAIPLRESSAANVVLTLAEAGFLVEPDYEDKAARYYYILEGIRKPLHFWITKRNPPRFCIGIRGDEVLRLLSERGFFIDDFRFP